MFEVRSFKQMKTCRKSEIQLPLTPDRERAKGF